MFEGYEKKMDLSHQLYQLKDKLITKIYNALKHHINNLKFLNFTKIKKKR